MIHLSNKGLAVDVFSPGEYYEGTRFDRAGVFRRVVKDGYIFADEWFSHQDPFRHDRVCGPSEEFVTVDFAGVPAGGLFCKPGVGLLRRPDNLPYDWFRLYEIVEPGIWEVVAEESEVEYVHTLPGWYRYVKRISLPDDVSMIIEHSMVWEDDRPLKGYCYNHNFFTFGGKDVGPSRGFAFPWKPQGDWRSNYYNVHFTGRGVAFTGPVDPSNSVYCGNLHNENGATSCEFTVFDDCHAVAISGSHAPEFCVLWANPHVACIEPYVPIAIAKNECFSWAFRYSFFSPH